MIFDTIYDNKRLQKQYLYFHQRSAGPPKYFRSPLIGQIPPKLVLHHWSPLIRRFWKSPKSPLLPGGAHYGETLTLKFICRMGGCKGLGMRFWWSGWGSKWEPWFIFLCWRVFCRATVQFLYTHRTTSVNSAYNLCSRTNKCHNISTLKTEYHDLS